ncbi:testis-expressed sequence 15 protein [Sigmodon hispidus]
MEMKENDKYKTWKISPDSESSWTTDTEANSGKKFTIPKIRRTTEKVYLSSCYTNTREYGFVHDTLKQCQLDTSCDLQLMWQFGDTKLVRNEYLEKQFSAKRSEMRESGRHGRELEEHFCFLALPQSDVLEIYQNGLSARASTLKILGNPLLGIYMFRHVDVALNYAHSRSTTVESIMIFKVLFGKVKKIQPSVDKNKVSLDPSPNFDCHMSRTMPSLKDTIELQAYNSMVYFYEYDLFSRPIDKPRQCLPYAIVTVKFIGQKAGNGQLMTSLRFPSTGFPKRLERECSLNNCTVAKRIGKGKDATIIFEHFRKPVDPFPQENCPCKALNSEMGPSNSDASSSYGNVQSGNSSVFESYSRQTDNSSEVRDASEIHTHNSSGLSLMPTANTASGNDDLFTVTYLRSILSGISAILHSQSSTGSSTVTTSKLIKDPRLMKREQSMRKQNNSTGLSDILPLDNSVGHGNSEIQQTCVPATSISSPETAPADHAVTNCSDASYFTSSSAGSHSQIHSMGSKDSGYATSSKIAITGQCEDQNSFSFPRYLPNAVSDVGKQKYNEEKAQKRSNIPVVTEQCNEPQKSYESEKNTCNKDSDGHISKTSWPSDLNAIDKVGPQMSTVFPVQKKGNLDECMQNNGMMKMFTSQETVNYFTNETKSSPIGNCITLHQETKEGGNLNSLRANCEKIPVTAKLQIPKSPMSTTKDKNELDGAALKLECNLTPNIGCLSQKHPQYTLEHKDNTHTNFAMAQGLIELKAVQNNQNFINIMTDAFQETKDVSLAREQLVDRAISSSAIDISPDSSDFNIIGEYMCIQRENENEYNLQKDYKETSRVKDDVQDHSLSYDAGLSSDVNLKINLQDENPNVAKEKDSASSSPEYNTNNINESEKQDFCTNIAEVGEIKSNTNVEILNPEECSTLNSICGKKSRPEKTASESEDSMAAITHRHTTRVENLVPTFPDIKDSSMYVTLNAAKQVVSSGVLMLSTNSGDHQKPQLKKTCSSEISDLSLVKYDISDCEIDTDKDKLQEFYQLGNKNSVPQTFELGCEIEVELEEGSDASFFQQNIHSHGNVLCEEIELYEALKSRIDWEGLFGDSNEDIETSSFTRREDADSLCSKGCNCVSFSSQKDKRELHNPIFLSDLQVTVTNLISLRIHHTDDSLESKDNFYKHVTECKQRKASKEGKAFGFGIYSQTSGENSGFSCENKCGDSVQESGHVSKPGTSHSTHGKLSTYSSASDPSNVAVINDKCPTESKPDLNDTRSKKDMESRSNKRNLHASSRGQNMSHKDLRQHEAHEKRRRPASHNSSECFSSLSQGRIKTFSQSERHIRDVLNTLNNEASLCKSKHLSRKLNKAVLHLKKAHRRVHTSLQIISKVGKKRKGPLPKAYSVICNNFWESCDLQGDSLMSERRYSRHFLSTKRYNKQEKKRLLRFDIDESSSPLSKHRSYRTKKGSIAQCLSSKILSAHVSSSPATFPVREFCDEGQLHESQLPLTYASQSVSQLECTDPILRNAGSSELKHSSRTSGYMSYPDGILPEKDYQTVAQLSKSGSTKLENHPMHNIKDITKENDSEDKTLVCESNSVSLSFIKENVSHSRDKSHNAAFKANTSILASVLDSDRKHFLNDAVCEQDGTRNGEIIIPVEKCTVLTEITPSIPTGNVANRYTISPLSPILVTAGEEESSVGDNGLFHIKENEVNITKHSKLDLASLTKESESCKKNVEKLPSSDSSLLLRANVKGLSRTNIAKFIDEEEMRKIEQAVYKKMITEESTVVIGYKHQNKILKESFHLQKKIIKNNLIGSHIGIKNSSLETITLKNTSSGLRKRQKAGQSKQLSNNSHSDCSSKPATAGTSHRPVVHNSQVTAPQKRPLSHTQKLKEHHLANYTFHVTELSQILQRADKAVSLQILEEEIKLCQNILPLFVEAFERKQGCSLDQIMISRKLLVEENSWNNCRFKLEPCAVDTWVELQMAMETVQFIENKRRFLEGEPTFRSLLWYDESLYSELLSRPRGYQLQANLYPAFQGRLKYNAFGELQSYHHQLVESLTKTKKEDNSYYAFLKYKRQINECEAIMKHYSDCFDFCLSVPFACGVNFGDSLGDLETLRKSVLKLISIHEGSPKVLSYPGKKDHLWIILEVVSSKVNFIKSNEEVSIQICLYGLEHIYFDAAKSLVWKEKSHIFPKTHSEKNRKMEGINECAFSKWKKICDVLSKDLNNESAPSIRPGEADMIASGQSALVSIPSCKLNNTWLSYPDIRCISEVLDQAKSADLEKLEDLTLRCTVHLEILKKYFQILQEDNIDNIFITEENVLDMLNHNYEAVILKPEAIEIYIETVMLSETIHFLKNSIAKKLHNQRFRGMLWFDWSLLPELVDCQKEMACFSVNDNQTDCLWKVIETTISHLKKELDVIYDYSEAVNCSYALRLFSRELKELSGIKKLLNTSEYSVSTYIDLVPHIASVNYGNTVAELEHNYNQLFTLLKNIMSVPQKDFGKMAHIIKVLKTIEHMKMISARGAKLSAHLLFFQVLRNRRNTLQLNRKEKSHTPITEPGENCSQPSISAQTPSTAECTVKNNSSFSRKRPVTVDKCEDSQGKGNTDAVSNCKKQKVTMKDVRNRQNTISKNPRNTESHPKDENQVGSNSFDNLKRDSASSETVRRQSSIPGLLSPSENLQDTCTHKAESKIKLTNRSSDASEHLTEHQENLNDIKKTNDEEDHPSVTCDQMDIDATCPPDSIFAQKSYENSADHTQICSSNIRAGNDDHLVLNTSMPTSHSVKAIHSNFEMNDTGFECEDNEILDLCIKDYTCTNSPEPVCIQDKIPVLQVDKTQPIKTESPEKCIKETPNPSITPFGSYGNSALDVNQAVQHTFSEQNGMSPSFQTQKVGTSWNACPQSTYTAVYNSCEHSFGTSYPYYAWCFYQYSSSNGAAITHTYQQMTTYETPPPPMMTAVAGVQNTHFNHSYSEHFSYFSRQPQANAVSPGNGYSPFPMPISYNHQQPVYSQFVPPQLIPQAAYTYPPNPGVLPQVPWTYAPWQQNPFLPRH